MSADARVLELAERQYGVVTRLQARMLGLSARCIEYRVESGRYEALFPGVYRVVGAPPSARQRAQASLLWLGDDAALSHLTATALLRLDARRPTRLRVSVPRENRKRSATLVPHRTLSLPRQDCVLVDGLRCTSASRTLVDIAAEVDDEALEVAFESARRMGLTSVRALERCAQPILDAGRPGARALRTLLGHQRRGEWALQYRLEVKAARLLRSSPLPRMERQVPVGPYRIDFALPGRCYGVECEGFEYHGSRLAWKQDKRRTSFIESQGWRLTFLSWDDVTQRPEEALRRISLALGLEAA